MYMISSRCCPSVSEWLKGYFQTNLCPSFYSKKDYSNGKHSRQLSVLPGVDVLQGQRETVNSLTATSQDLQASVCMLNLKVHKSTIRKKWTSFVWKEGRKNPLIFKKNMAAQLRFATLHLKNPQDSYEGRCLVIMQSFGVVMHSTVFGKKQTQHISTTTSYKLSNTVETWWWWWSQDPVTLQSLDLPWTPGFTKVF